MLVNFGLRDKFDINGNNFLPTGFNAEYQWDYLESQRYNFNSIIGSVPHAFYKRFYSKVVKPLSEIGADYGDNSCTCTQRGIMKNDSDHLQLKSPAVVGLDDIFELMLRTSSLPDISPMFSSRGAINLDGSELVQLHCLYNQTLDGVRLIKSTKTETEIGLSALARAPYSRFAHSFFGDTLWRAIDNIKDSGVVNKQVMTNGIKSFARLMIAAGVSEPLYMANWYGNRVRNAYYSADHFFPGSIGITSILLQMTAGQEWDTFPNRTMIDVYGDPAKLSRLASIVAHESMRLHNSEYKKDGTRKKFTPLDFKLLVSAAHDDIDYALLTSLNEGAVA